MIKVKGKKVEFDYTSDMLRKVKLPSSEEHYKQLKAYLYGQLPFALITTLLNPTKMVDPRRDSKTGWMNQNQILKTSLRLEGIRGYTSPVTTFPPAMKKLVEDGIVIEHIHEYPDSRGKGRKKKIYKLAQSLQAFIVLRHVYASKDYINLAIRKLSEICYLDYFLKSEYYKNLPKKIHEAYSAWCKPIISEAYKLEVQSLEKKRDMLKSEIKQVNKVLKSYGEGGGK